MVSDSNQLKLYKKEIGELKRKLEQLSSSSSNQDNTSDEIGKRRKTLPDDLQILDQHHNIVRSSISNICSGDFSNVSEQFLPVVEFIQNQKTEIKQLEKYVMHCQELTQFANTESMVLKENSGALQAKVIELSAELDRSALDRICECMSMQAVDLAYMEIKQEESDFKLLEHHIEAQQKIRNVENRVIASLQLLMNPIEKMENLRTVATSMSSRMEGWETSIDHLKSKLDVSSDISKNTAQENATLKSQIEVSKIELSEARDRLQVSKSLLTERETLLSSEIERLSKANDEISYLLKAISQEDANLIISKLKDSREIIGTTAANRMDLVLEMVSSLHAKIETLSNSLEDKSLKIQEQEELIKVLNTKSSFDAESSQEKIAQLESDKNDLVESLDNANETIIGLQKDIEEKSYQLSETANSNDTALKPILDELELEKTKNAEANQKLEAIFDGIFS